MSTKRTYKIVQDIDLSQNTLNNVKSINNNSEIDIHSNNKLNLTANELSMKVDINDVKKGVLVNVTNTESNTIIDSDVTTINNSNAINLTTTSYNVQSTNNTVTSNNYVNSSDNITMGGESNAITISGQNMLLQSGDNSQLGVKKIIANDGYINNKVVIGKEVNKQFSIEWDENTNSINFVKLTNNV